MLRACTLAILCLLPVGPALATDEDAVPGTGLVYEVKIGAQAHDVPLIGRNKEPYGPNLDVEVMLSPAVPFLFGTIRPTIGGSVNFEGYTSKAYLDARWTLECCFGFFAGVGGGVAVHNGELGSFMVESFRKQLGRRALYHPSLEYGYRFNEHHSVSIFFEHISNGFNENKNEGIDSVTLRYGYRPNPPRRATPVAPYAPDVVYETDDPALVSLSIGYYDQTLFDPGIGFLRVSPDKNKHKEAVDFRGEYRPALSFVPWIEPWAKLKPWIGAEGTSDGALYVLGGILFDIPIGPLVLTPSFGAGLYTAGAGKVLGHPVEFRTQLELGYVFENRSRVSLAYSHISNANLDELNPGSNIISVYYHVPLGWFSHYRPGFD
jgi:hypothetical protein